MKPGSLPGILPGIGKFRQWHAIRRNRDEAYTIRFTELLHRRSKGTAIRTAAPVKEEQATGFSQPADGPVFRTVGFILSDLSSHIVDRMGNRIIKPGIFKQCFLPDFREYRRPF